MSDHRRSRHFPWGAAREAAIGGTVALVHEGDSIAIDACKRLLRLDLVDEELAPRRAGWKARSSRYPGGVLVKHAKLVSSASPGGATD